MVALQRISSSGASNAADVVEGGVLSCIGFPDDVIHTRHSSTSIEEAAVRASLSSPTMMFRGSGGGGSGGDRDKE